MYLMLFGGEGAYIPHLVINKVFFSFKCFFINLFSQYRMTAFLE